MSHHRWIETPEQEVARLQMWLLQTDGPRHSDTMRWACDRIEQLLGVPVDNLGRPLERQP